MQSSQQKRRHHFARPVCSVLADSLPQELLPVVVVVVMVLVVLMVLHLCVLFLRVWWQQAPGRTVRPGVVAAAAVAV